MDLLVGTVTLRPYVFAFLIGFVVAGVVDLGWRHTLGFTVSVWPVALLAELSSTRTGFPFGLYQYTGLTRGQELFIADVPFIDSLSFVFLAYASFCLARITLAGRGAPRWAMALTAGVLMMALDIVIDPLAVRGDRWFLGPLFAYVKAGVLLRGADLKLRGVGDRGRDGGRPVPGPDQECFGTTSMARSRVILRRAWI
jgi:putative membrane protein